MNEFYYRLISLPLFQGLTREDTLDMAGQARFDFRRLDEGDTIVSEGQECQELIFIIQGEILMSEPAPDGSYRMEEYIPAPCVVQPERLFGRRPRYTRNATAASNDVQLLVVSKRDVRDILFSYTAFHLNYLNYVCSLQQTLLQQLWMPADVRSLRQRFIGFLQFRSTHLGGRKRLIIGMNELADCLDSTRLNISRLLHELEAEGLVQLQRGIIDIPSFPNLLTSMPHA